MRVVQKIRLQHFKKKIGKCIRLHKMYRDCTVRIQFLHNRRSHRCTSHVPPHWTTFQPSVSPLHRQKNVFRLKTPWAWWQGIDRNLNFTKHIQTTINKAKATQFTLYPLINNKSLLPISTKIYIYKIYIRPIYAAPIWASNISKTCWRKL